MNQILLYVDVRIPMYIYGQSIHQPKFDRLSKVYPSVCCMYVGNQFIGHSGVVNSIAYSPYSGGIIASGADDHSIQLWSSMETVQYLRQRLHLQSHDNAIEEKSLYAYHNLFRSGVKSKEL